MKKIYIGIVAVVVSIGATAQEPFADSSNNILATGINNVSIAADYTNVGPVRLTDLKLMQRGNAISINWSALNETAMDNYEIQKSSNGWEIS